MFDNFLTLLSFFLTIIACAFSLVTFVHIRLDKTNEKFRDISISDNDMFSYKKPPSAYAFVKRTFDIVVSFLSLIILSPIIIIVSIAIKLYDGGPIFLKQKIYGKDYQIIKKYKFRTTSNNSQNKTTTPIGNFIRRNGLYIIPIYYNVLIGNMTLIGLWNNYSTELHDADKTKDVFYYGKPGLVNATVLSTELYDLSPQEITKYDQFYLTNRGFKLDAKILIMCLLKAFE